MNDSREFRFFSVTLLFNIKSCFTLKRDGDAGGLTGVSGTLETLNRLRDDRVRDGWGEGTFLTVSDGTGSGGGEIFEGEQLKDTLREMTLEISSLVNSSVACSAIDLLIAQISFIFFTNSL